MAEKINVQAEITVRYGAVKRARGCYLYTQSGIRLTDMAQDGGRAILGWGFGKARQILKNVIDRGYTGCCMPAADNMLQNALKTLLPEVSCFRVYSSELKIDRVCGKKPVMWRPWDVTELSPAGKNLSSCIEICMPFSWPPYRVFVFTEMHPSIEPSDALPAPVATAMTRALYDLASELPVRTEADWCAYDLILGTYWKRRGPYLSPLVTESLYHDFFIHCLDAHLVISCDYDVPSVIPFRASDGCFTPLKKKPFLV